MHCVRGLLAIRVSMSMMLDIADVRLQLIQVRRGLSELQGAMQCARGV